MAQVEKAQSPVKAEHTFVDHVTEGNTRSHSPTLADVDLEHGHAPPKSGSDLAGSGGRPRRGTTASNNPSLHHDHPINFTEWRKWGILITLAWSGFLTNYMASAHLTAFVPMAGYFGRPVPDIANTIGYGLLGVAVGPLIWNPLSKTVGRRPTYLLGSLLFIPCVIWLALSKSYTSFCIARVFAGIVSSFSQTVPPSSIADIYPKEVRGDKIAFYGVFVVIAPAVSPFIGGLVINDHGWQVIYWIILGFAGLQLVMFFLLVPETLWIEHGAEDEIAEEHNAVYETSATGETVRAGRRGAAWMPWHRPAHFAKICWNPIAMLRYMPITLPSFYYGYLFAASVSITIVLPQIFERAPYNFGEIPVGCTYLAFGVGSVLGKWSGGIVGDKVVTAVTKRKGGIRLPEYRFYALLPILPFMFVGLFLVGLPIQNDWHWIIPLVFGALYYFCLVASTGIIQTYVLETFISRSMDTQAVFVFWKMIWGFAVAFFAFQWGEKTGFTAEYATWGALATGLGFILSLGLIWKGEALRQLQNMPGARQHAK